MFSWVPVRHLLHKTTAAAHVAEAIRSGSSVQWAVVCMNKHLTFLSQVFPPPGVLRVLQRSEVCPCVKMESADDVWGWCWCLQTIPAPQSHCLPSLLGKTIMDMHNSRWFWVQKPGFDSFCLRGNMPCGVPQSQISRELYQCTLTPTQHCMPVFSFFRQISMSHQLLPTQKPLQKHYPSLTACPLSTYMCCMAEGKYEADIIPTTKY